MRHHWQNDLKIFPAASASIMMSSFISTVGHLLPFSFLLEMKSSWQRINLKFILCVQDFGETKYFLAQQSGGASLNSI